jgi:hypothetical protein
MPHPTDQAIRSLRYFIALQFVCLAALKGHHLTAQAGDSPAASRSPGFAPMIGRKPGNGDTSAGSLGIPTMKF